MSGASGAAASTGPGSPTILTVTPNPSLDLLFETELLVWDDANRLPMPRRRAGGQGINVVRAVRALGGAAVAIAPLGGATGDQLEAMLLEEGTPLRVVPIARETRLFVAVRERATGRNLLLNPRGPALDAHSATLDIHSATLDADRSTVDADGATPADTHESTASRSTGPAHALLTATCDAIDELDPSWVAGCGSLPPGLDERLYVEVGRLARQAGARWVPDCDGPALRAAVEAGCDLVVPNEHEAGRLLHRRIESVDDAAAAARSLLDYGPARACVTLAERGAVGADASGRAWHAVAPHRSHGSAVGAGDAFLGRLLLALDTGRPMPDALRLAVAAGAAVLYSSGTSLVDADTAAELEPKITLRRV